MPDEPTATFHESVPDAGVTAMDEDKDSYAASEVKSMSDNHEGEGFRTEKIIAVWNHDEDGTPMWLFRDEDISPLFRQVFGTNWQLRVYSFDAWKDVLDLISKPEADRRPQGIELDLKYVWRRKGAKLQVAVHFLDIRVTPLSLDFLAEEEEGCQCEECQSLYADRGIRHASDCAVHNEPAYPKGPCDCDALAEVDLAPTSK